MKYDWRRPNRVGFTLTEVVLAIALTAVVVYLITTAIELYVVGVDSSRSKVESAQLARALLDQIADDLASARLNAPPQATVGGAPSGSQQGAAGGGGQSPQGNNISAGGNAGSSAFGSTGSTGSAGSTGAPPNAGPTPPPTPATVQGIYGTTDLVRVDRGPLANWERASRLVDAQEITSRADMPVSVRYYFLDAQRLTSQRLAERGVSADAAQDVSVSGLYRETQPSAALAATGDTTTAASAGLTEGAEVELLAPEVVSFALRYFDGTDFVTEWDTLREGGLPTGVEIRLTLVEPQFQVEPDADREERRREGRYDPNELVEYRRFVRLPRVDPSPPAQALLPGSNPNQGGGQPGQPGQPGGAPPQNNQ